jgi:pyridoxine kinase
MNILSIQSHVAYGHAGNSAAVFPLQRIGVEVWPVHTVAFSNHTGYGAWRGPQLGADAVRLVVQGIEERGVLGQCDGVLSGYIGSPDVGEAVIDTVARVKRANPAARACCDPVIGDTGRGIFVRQDIPEFIKQRLLPIADIVTPNQFELEYLTGRATPTLDDLVAAIDAVHARGPGVVLVTSMRIDDTPNGSIDLAVSDGVDRCRLRLPELPVAVGGAGDVLAALFFAHHLRSGSAAEAMSRAASSVFGVLKRTLEAGAKEMLLVAAQEEFAHPARIFAAEKI